MNAMRNTAIFIAILGFFVFLSGRGWAREIPAIPEFTKDDRVLVLAAHPDDETLGAGGVIQRARAAGARVQVLCFTNGDHNELAFIVYEKRFTFRTGEFIYMGEMRRNETIKALTYLGLPRSDMIFLGYPDFGTMAILTQYWQTPKPFWCLLTRISKVAYPDALCPGAPYVGESVLKDMETVLGNFQPTKIFVNHPADTNRDHQALYLFTRIALWDLEGKIPRVEVYPYIIHVIGWPQPRGHHLDLFLTPPDSLTGISWKQLVLSGQETRTKEKMVDFFKTEIEYNPPYLYSYVRRNELFGDFPEIELEGNKPGPAVWSNAALLSELPDEKTVKAGKRSALSGLFYSVQDNSLLIKLDLKRKLDKNLGITINLLGYSKDEAFEVMPKISVSIGLLGMRIMNKAKQILVPEARLKFEGRSLIIKLPMALLGNPDRILSKVRTHTAQFPLEASAWRILRIK
jgi:LmbE family N-acetylglucosaminyl deacetylase